MPEKKELGKIKGAYIGMHDGHFGAHFTLGGHSWSAGDYWPVTGGNMERVYQLMVDAKVTEFQQLVGKPVSVMFEGNVRKNWRILTEVL